jgi:hypothetical protein
MCQLWCHSINVKYDLPTLVDLAVTVSRRRRSSRRVKVKQPLLPTPSSHRSKSTTEPDARDFSTNTVIRLEVGVELQEVERPTEANPIRVQET